MRLTKRAIDSLTYTRKSGAQCVWDDDLAGFGVRIYPTGRKSFVVAYRADGRQRFFTIGRVGELTVHEARTKAMEVLASARRGEDPSGDRIAYREAPTMTDLADRYMREHARPRKKPSGVANDDRVWRKHVLPRLGKKKVADVTRAEIFELHARIGETTPIQANRILALLSKAFNLCEIWGWRTDGSNPVRHVPRFPENKRERYLSESELLRLAKTLNEKTQWVTKQVCPRSQRYSVGVEDGELVIRRSTNGWLARTPWREGRPDHSDCSGVLGIRPSLRSPSSRGSRLGVLPEDPRVPGRNA